MGNKIIRQQIIIIISASYIDSMFIKTTTATNATSATSSLRDYAVADTHK